MDGADGVGVGARVTAEGGEGGEVVGAGEETGGGFEEGEIERVGDVPCAVVHEGREDWGVPEVIAVGFAGGEEARVEVRGGGGGGHDADFRWEVDIEGAEPCGWVHAAGIGDVEVGDLAIGVDTGVSAAAALDGDWLGEDGGGGGFEDVLDGAAAGL